MHEPWAAAQAALLEVLGASTIDQVAARDRELALADRAAGSGDLRGTRAARGGAGPDVEDLTSG